MRSTIYLLLFLHLIACNEAKNSKEKYSLKIAIKANYGQYLSYPSISRKLENNVYYDSIQNLTIYKYDSLKKGQVNISIFSLLSDDFERKITLKKDTTIYFDTALYSNFIKTRKLKEFTNLKLGNQDTIYISQKASGCFGGSIEKIRIYKQMNSYLIDYFGFQNQQLIVSDSFFAKQYFDFLSQAKILFPEKENPFTFTHMSTTKTDTYIRNGNTVLEFPDLYEWKGYEIFKKRIGITKSE